jgi:hypothetical protein
MVVKIKRKIEITTETEEVLVVRGRQIINARCEICGGEAEMVPAEQAATRTGYSLPEICQQAEVGKLHCQETRVLLICLNSLADHDIGPEISEPEVSETDVEVCGEPSPRKD